MPDHADAHHLVATAAELADKDRAEQERFVPGAPGRWDHHPDQMDS